MKLLNLLFLTLFLLFFSLNGKAQLMSPTGTFISSSNYQECAAILYNGELLVDKYSPEGQCRLEYRRRGKLSLSTVKLDEENATPVKNIDFRIAIKNDRTQTIWMYSNEIYQEVELEDILRKCELGDRIIFMTVDQQYSLPHHEIEVNGGC